MENILEDYGGRMTEKKDRIICPDCGEEIECIINESYSGTWHQDKIVSPSEAMAYHTKKKHKKKDS